MSLAESFDKVDFEVKLSSLADQWNSLCPGFHPWFVKKEAINLYQALCSQHVREQMSKDSTTKTTWSGCTLSRKLTKSLRSRYDCSNQQLETIG